MLFWRRYVLFLVVNIGIIISVNVILKKIELIAIPIYLDCCNIPKGYISNSSKISDDVNIVEITATQHYLTREKKSGKSDQIFCKWLNFYPTFFIPTSMFPRFFSPHKEFIPIFFQLLLLLLLLLLFPIYLQNLLLPCFSRCPLYRGWAKQFYQKIRNASESKELKKITSTMI